MMTTTGYEEKKNLYVYSVGVVEYTDCISAKK